MGKKEKDSIEIIEHEIVTLMRRADFKRTLDGHKDSLDRSGYLILKLLAAEGPLSIRVIAEIFHLNMSTVSRQVRTLESGGLVNRKPEKSDARVSMISMTDDGKNKLETSSKYRCESYMEVLADWSEDEKNIFASLLTRLNRAIEKRRKLQ
ncbi:MarR family transcriptional regulator [Bacillus cereus]|nr:MarR family transcriptional regulator [Bacillus cereus]